MPGRVRHRSGPRFQPYKATPSNRASRLSHREPSTPPPRSVPAAAAGMLTSGVARTPSQAADRFDPARRNRRRSTRLPVRRAARPRSARGRCEVAAPPGRRRRATSDGFRCGPSSRTATSTLLNPISLIVRRASARRSAAEAECGTGDKHGSLRSVTTPASGAAFAHRALSPFGLSMVGADIAPPTNDCKRIFAL